MMTTDASCQHKIEVLPHFICANGMQCICNRVRCNKSVRRRESQNCSRIGVGMIIGIYYMDWFRMYYIYKVLWCACSRAPIRTWTQGKRKRERLLKKRDMQKKVNMALHREKVVYTEARSRVSLFLSIDSAVCVCDVLRP